MTADNPVTDFDVEVLRAVADLDDNAYGVPILDAMEKTHGHRPLIGTLYASLLALEQNGYLESHRGNATPERGGRRKMFLRLTAKGRQELSRE